MVLAQALSARLIPMETKNCIGCATTKPISDFYHQKGNRDGRQGRCKECVKHASRISYQAIMKDPVRLEKERKRQREKEAKRRALGLTNDYEARPAKEWRSRNPEKYRAHRAVNCALRSGKIAKDPCEECGSTESEAHHPDYSRPLYVAWLCKKHHAERHIQERNEKLRVLIKP